MQTSRFRIHCRYGIEILRKNVFGVFRIIEVYFSRIDICNEQ